MNYCLDALLADLQTSLTVNGGSLGNEDYDSTQQQNVTSHSYQYQQSNQVGLDLFFVFFKYYALSPEVGLRHGHVQEVQIVKLGL